jgi:protein TonB
VSHGDQNRIFHFAILASLALHALLFLGFPDLINSARRAVENFPPPILARLIAPEPVAPPVAEPSVAKEKPPAPPVPKPTPPKVAKPLAVPAPAPDPVPVAAPKPEPVSPTPPAESPSAAEVPPAPVASALPAQPAPQPGAAAAARAARTIGEYRLELIEAANRIKDSTRYPPIARDNNWTGSTTVGVVVAASGAPAVTVRGASRHPVLDQHALAIFRQAAREVPLPQELRGREFAVEVRMDFTLKD